MEDKYIELLLKKCLDLEKSKSLCIMYNVVNQDFIDKLVEKARLLGVNEIHLVKSDADEERELLKSISLDEIDNHPYFDRSKLNDYSAKGSNFLIFRAPFANTLDGVDSKKL